MPALTYLIDNHASLHTPTPLKTWNRDGSAVIEGNIYYRNAVEMLVGEVTPGAELEMIERLNKWFREKGGFLIRCETLTRYDNIVGMVGIGFIKEKLWEEMTFETSPGRWQEYVLKKGNADVVSP